MKKGADKAMISVRESKYKLKQTPRRDNSCGDKANHGKNRRGGETDRLVPRARMGALVRF